MNFRVPILLFVLVLAFENVSTADKPPAVPFPELECRRLLSETEPQLASYLKANEREYQDLKERILREGIPQSQFNLVMLDLFNTFRRFRHRIAASPFYDGKFVAKQFLRGVTLWASDYRQLRSAIGKFWLVDSANEGWKTDPEKDLSLLYFAAQMAWVVDAYDFQNGGDRRHALLRLADFDETNAIENQVQINYESGKVSFRRRGPTSMVRLQSKGLNVSETPVGPPKCRLEFNNGRLNNSFSISDPEMWVAQELSRIHRREIFLGIGDLSVRQFFPLIRVEPPNRINRYPYSADFLSVGYRKEPNSWYFVIRELKFNAPWDNKVAVGHALKQLESTWIGLHEMYGDEIPVGHLEIVIPNRSGENKWPRIGEGYFLGRQTQHKLPLYELRDEDNKKVWIKVGRKNLPVRVRQMSLTDEKYAELTKRRR